MKTVAHDTNSFSRYTVLLYTYRVSSNLTNAGAIVTFPRIAVTRASIVLLLVYDCCDYDLCIGYCKHRSDFEIDGRIESHVAEVTLELTFHHDNLH